MYSKFLIAVIILLPCMVLAGKFPGPEEVLSDTFPGAAFERETSLLTGQEKSEVAELSGQEQPRALVSRYVISQNNNTIGYAYLDKHKVRTLPEILMIVLGADGVLQNIHVLAFREPVEYLPREGWYNQFVGKSVGDEIRMKKNIDGITGATLTARATTQCARRVMAIHKVLMERAP